MPYQVVNRHKGFIILPNGQKLDKGSSTRIEEATPEFRRMEKRGLISIHYLIEPKQTKVDNLAGWEDFINLAIAPTPEFPPLLNEGAILFNSGEKYMLEHNEWKHKGYAIGMVVSYEIDGEKCLMIDITGVDIIKFGQDVFDLSATTGKARFLTQPATELSSEEVMQYVFPSGEILLQMDKVKGRDCKMTVYRNMSGFLLINLFWANHSMDIFIELLRRHGII